MSGNSKSVQETAIENVSAEVRRELHRVLISLEEDIRAKNNEINDLNDKLTEKDRIIGEKEEEIKLRGLKLLQSEQEFKRMENLKTDAEKELVEKEKQHQREKDTDFRIIREREDKVRADMHKLEQEIRNLRHDKEDVEAREKFLEQNRVEYEENMKKLRDEHSLHLSKISNEFDLSKKALEVRYDEILCENDENRSRCNSLDQTITDLRRRLGEYETKVQQHSAEKSALLTDFDLEKKRWQLSMDDQIKSHKRDLELKYEVRYGEMAQSEAVYRAKLSEYEAEITTLRNENRDLHHQKSVLDNTISKLYLQLEHVTRSRAEILEDIKRSRQDCQMLYEDNIRNIREQYRRSIAVFTSSWKISDTRFPSLVNELLTELSNMTVAIYPYRILVGEDETEFDPRKSSFVERRRSINPPATISHHLPHQTATSQLTDISTVMPISDMLLSAPEFRHQQQHAHYDNQLQQSQSFYDGAHDAYQHSGTPSASATKYQHSGVPAPLSYQLPRSNFNNTTPNLFNHNLSKVSSTMRSNQDHPSPSYHEASARSASSSDPKSRPRSASTSKGKSRK